MTVKDFTVDEIYSGIYVYSNVFENPQKMYDIILSSENNDEPGIWEDWQNWYGFGKKIENFGISFDKSVPAVQVISSTNIENEKQKDQEYFIKEQVQAFMDVTSDYMSKNNLDIIEECKKTVEAETEIFKWIWTGPSLCKYYTDFTDNNEDGMSMRYHSDYIREPIKSPGHKFVLTCTTYLNDDYEDGAVDFYINKKLIRYKPKAGDLLVFPSGHPDYLTENGKVYLHGVESCKGAEKYFTRMYWQVYEDGSEEWKQNEATYGKEEWLKMNAEISKQYHSDNIAKSKIEGAIRVI